MSSTTILTRAELAERLRQPAQELVSRSSWRQAAKQMGIKVGALRSLVTGGVPQEENVEALAAWGIRAGHLSPALAPSPLAIDGQWLPLEEIGERVRKIR